MKLHSGEFKAGEMEDRTYTTRRVGHLAVPLDPALYQRDNCPEIAIFFDVTHV